MKYSCDKDTNPYSTENTRKTFHEAQSKFTLYYNCRAKKNFLYRNDEELTVLDESNQKQNEVKDNKTNQEQIESDQEVSELIDKQNQEPISVIEVTDKQNHEPVERIEVSDKQNQESIDVIDVTDKQNHESVEPIEVTHKQDQVSIELKDNQEQKPTELVKRIHEFYHNQSLFHKKMAMFSKAFSDDISLSAKNKIRCQELLRPISVLSNNPFNDDPTGDVRTDIQHILDVIKTQNNEYEDAIKNYNFQTALNALALSNSMAEITQEILDEVKQNPESVEIIKNTMHYHYWMDVEGHVAIPMQILTRMVPLLETIQKAANKETEDMGDLIEQLEITSKDLSKKVQFINDNADDLKLLGRIQNVLQQICDLEEIDKYSIYINISENNEIYTECYAYLMTKPKEDNYDFYKKSEKNKLYLYQENDGKIFYYIQEEQKKYYLTKDNQNKTSEKKDNQEEVEFFTFSKQELFRSTNEKMTQYSDKGIAKEIFLITSRRGHTPYEMKLKKHIKSTINTTRQALRNVIHDNQDICLLYHELLKLIKEIAIGCTKINTSRTFYHVVSSVVSYLYPFKQEDKNNPIKELNNIIEHLGILVERLDIILSIPSINEKARLDFCIK